MTESVSLVLGGVCGGCVGGDCGSLLVVGMSRCGGWVAMVGNIMVV